MERKGKCRYCDEGYGFAYDRNRPDYHLIPPEAGTKQRAVLRLCANRARLYELVIAPAKALAARLDIGANAEPTALFDDRGGCINVWATPDDNPGGPWTEFKMLAGAHCKPSEFVGTISWNLDDRNVTRIVFDTDAYALADHFPGRFSQDPRRSWMLYRVEIEVVNEEEHKTEWKEIGRDLPYRLAQVQRRANRPFITRIVPMEPIHSIKDRAADLRWLRSKARWLFKQASVDLARRGIPIVLEKSVKKEGV